jgi:hypothetical protein
MQKVTAIAEVVFAMHFDPVDGGHRCQKIGVVRLSEPDADTCQCSQRAGFLAVRSDGCNVSHVNQVPAVPPSFLQVLSGTVLKSPLS